MKAGAGSVQRLESECDGLVRGQLPALLPGLGEGSLVELRADERQRFVVRPPEPAPYLAGPDIFVQRLATGEDPGRGLRPSSEGEHAGEAADEHRLAEPVSELSVQL